MRGMLSSVTKHDFIFVFCDWFRKFLCIVFSYNGFPWQKITRFSGDSKSFYAE